MNNFSVNIKNLTKHTIVIKISLYLQNLTELNHFFMSLRKLLAIFSLLCVSAFANAGTYLISPAATTAGETITYDGKKYIVGITAFATPKALLAAAPAEKSTVNIAPGTYSEAFTISINGLKLIGPNAYIDARAQTRVSPAIFTARIGIKANSIEINGLDFSGNGQVYNTTATREAPVSGLIFRFNSISGSTLERKKNNAFLNLGKAADGEDAVQASSRLRYSDINIQHNIFKGDATPNFIQLAGASGTTTVSDNKFSSGGTSIRLDNTVGTVNIKFNKFMEVGESTKSLGGDFCIQINRSAGESSTTFNIQHNDFRNCVGQTSLYPVIRFYPGAAGSTNLVNPVNCSMNVNHNVFRGKTQVHADYNYLYYADKGTSGDVASNFRFNVFDNTDYQFAFANRPGQTSLQRFYATAFGPVDTKNCTFGTFKAATAISAATVLQSFDVDPATGDMYYVQLSGAGTINGDPKPLYITRLKPDGTKSKMTLTWAGHGTNLAVANIGGKPYIFTGGRATLKADGSETRADACCWFRYVGGSTADLRKTSFTHNSTTYPIKAYDREGKNNEYPAIDEVSRLFCSRTTGTGKNYFQIFDLDEMLADPSSAKAIKSVTLNKGDNPTSNASDKGYNTWDHQGYTIHGDYLYIMEGVGTESSTALSGKPTLFLHVYDWRRNKFVYRRRLSDATLLANTHGEPEGVKVRLNSSGHAEILVGVAVGSSGSRKAAIYKYTPKSAAFSLSNAKHSASESSISLTTTSGVKVSKDITTTNTNLHGGVTTPVSGSKQFSASKSKASAWHAETTVTVTYTPVDDVKQHSGFLRISSPMATDVTIPINAVNTTATGVGDVSVDAAAEPVISIRNGYVTVEGLTPSRIEIFNAATGAMICSSVPEDTPQLTARGVYIVRVTTLGDHRWTKKIIL